MKILLKLTMLSMLLGISSQAAFANALQEKIQARKDIVAYGKKFECEDFVKSAHGGDLLLVDAFLKAGIDQTCQFTQANEYVLVEPYRPRAWHDNALSAALSSGNFDIAQMLLDYGVPFEQERKYWEFKTQYPTGRKYSKTMLWYPRPTLISLLYIDESKKEIKTGHRIKALQWAVSHGADVNATELLGAEYYSDYTTTREYYVVSPLTAAMRLERFRADDDSIYERSLTWVEYLLKNGAKLNPPIAPIFETTMQVHKKHLVNYPFDLSVLLKESYGATGYTGNYGIFKNHEAVKYRIELAKLLIKYQDAKTDKQKYISILTDLKGSMERDRDNKRFPQASRKALLELDGIIRARMK